ncbi:hypothetical protein [Sphingobium cloacae]|uniref:Uncharacterized protein n=1 Tax=Sphingobium cloacae TaxID=120107 RepID=A0A1E1F5X9_9SPHN|nr:hypothetical protein [Sphingobium cloacae]BAV65930.1 hypothetical protein SCLO_1028900 [Sphingobium cloacae]
MALWAYRNAEWLVAIHAMVDDVCVQDGAMPPGLFGNLTRLVDGVRSDSPDDMFLSRADDMLVAIHRLRSAMRHRSPQADPAAIRRELGHMCRDWMSAARFC